MILDTLEPMLTLEAFSEHVHVQTQQPLLLDFDIVHVVGTTSKPPLGDRVHVVLDQVVDRSSSRRHLFTNDAFVLDKSATHLEAVGLDLGLQIAVMLEHVRDMLGVAFLCEVYEATLVTFFFSSTRG